VLAANPQLVSFDLLRSGDDVTLTLSLRRGSDRVDFRLLGTKHDYYRVSMGVRLEETVALLAQADPNLEAGGAEIRGETLVLRFQYSGPVVGVPAAASLSPPLPAAAAPPAPLAPRGGAPGASPAAAPEPPPGAESEVAVPPSGAPLEGPARVTETAAPRVPTPSASSALPESGADEAYRSALRQDTLPAWSRFLERHPNAPEADEARRRAAVLREDAAYRTALERNDTAGYRAFLEHFPDSGRRPEMEARLRVVDEERRRADAERRAAGATARRREEAYSEARKLDTAEAYRIFLTVYPDAPEAPEARKRLQRTAADDDAFEEARGSSQGLEAYLAERPKGRHAKEARRLLQDRLAAQSEREFREALDTGTKAGWQRYLTRWSDGERAREAREALESLEARRPETGEAPSARGRGPSLVAPRVRTPPTVDGSGGDRAWREAEALEVPLTGGPGPKTLRVRAVHDGKSLYLLAEWADPSRDTLYRPWVWDAARETYYQNEQLDDALAVALYRSAPTDSCMLQGDDVDADSWLWRAFWSEISGLADDGMLRVSQTRVPQSNPYPVSGGRGQVWVREDSDEGVSGWFFFIPVDFQGETVSSYTAQQATGSRADVQARGRWSEETGTGTWTVEFARALDTRRADDVALAEGRSQPVAFAVFDKRDKGRHASSALVQLELRGR